MVPFASSGTEHVVVVVVAVVVLGAFPSPVTASSCSNLPCQNGATCRDDAAVRPHGYVCYCPIPIPETPEGWKEAYLGVNCDTPTCTFGYTMKAFHTDSRAIAYPQTTLDTCKTKCDELNCAGFTFGVEGGYTVCKIVKASDAPAYPVEPYSSGGDHFSFYTKITGSDTDPDCSSSKYTQDPCLFAPCGVGVQCRAGYGNSYTCSCPENYNFTGSSCELISDTAGTNQNDAVQTTIIVAVAVSLLVVVISAVVVFVLYRRFKQHDRPTSSNHHSPTRSESVQIREGYEHLENRHTDLDMYDSINPEALSHVLHDQLPAPPLPPDNARDCDSYVYVLPAEDESKPGTDYIAMDGRSGNKKK